MRRDLLGWLVVAAWLLLVALACGLTIWAVGPVRGAPLPFARPPRPAPSLAGAWWYAFGEGSMAAGWEVHLHADGHYQARHWEDGGPNGEWWSGTWRRDGGTVRVREAMVPPGRDGPRDRDWSFPVAALRRAR